MIIIKTLIHQFLSDKNFTQKDFSPKNCRVGAAHQNQLNNDYKYLYGNNISICRLIIYFDGSSAIKSSFLAPPKVQMVNNLKVPLLPFVKLIACFTWWVQVG